MLPQDSVSWVNTALSILTWRVSVVLGLDWFGFYICIILVL